MHAEMTHSMAVTKAADALLGGVAVSGSEEGRGGGVLARQCCSLMLEEVIRGGPGNMSSLQHI